MLIYDKSTNRYYSYLLLVDNNGIKSNIEIQKIVNFNKDLKLAYNF